MATYTDAIHIPSGGGLTGWDTLNRYTAKESISRGDAVVINAGDNTVEKLSTFTNTSTSTKLPNTGSFLNNGQNISDMSGLIGPTLNNQYIVENNSGDVSGCTGIPFSTDVNVIWTDASESPDGTRLLMYGYDYSNRNRIAIYDISDVNSEPVQLVSSGSTSPSILDKGHCDWVTNRVIAVTRTLTDNSIGILIFSYDGYRNFAQEVGRISNVDLSLWIGIGSGNIYVTDFAASRDNTTGTSGTIMVSYSRDNKYNENQGPYGCSMICSVNGVGNIRPRWTHPLDGYVEHIDVALGSDGLYSISPKGHRPVIASINDEIQGILMEFSGSGNWLRVAFITFRSTGRSLVVYDFNSTNVITAMSIGCDYCAIYTPTDGLGIYGRAGSLSLASPQPSGTVTSLGFDTYNTLYVGLGQYIDIYNFNGSSWNKSSTCFSGYGSTIVCSQTYRGGVMHYIDYSGSTYFVGRCIRGSRAYPLTPSRHYLGISDSSVSRGSNANVYTMNKFGAQLYYREV